MKEKNNNLKVLFKISIVFVLIILIIIGIILRKNVSYIREFHKFLNMEINEKNVNILTYYTISLISLLILFITLLQFIKKKRVLIITTVFIMLFSLAFSVYTFRIPFAEERIYGSSFTYGNISSADIVLKKVTYYNMYMKEIK